MLSEIQFCKEQEETKLSHETNKPGARITDGKIVSDLTGNQNHLQEPSEPSSKVLTPLVCLNADGKGNQRVLRQLTLPV